MSQKDVIEIAKRASEKNKTIGVTGMMVCHHGSILQVLEGDKPVIEALYAKICTDSRHTQILLLISRDTERREFKDWAMGLQYLPDDSADTDVTPLFTKSYKEILPEDASDVLRMISKSFARVNRIAQNCD